MATRPVHDADATTRALAVFLAEREVTDASWTHRDCRTGAAFRVEPRDEACLTQLASAAQLASTRLATIVPRELSLRERVAAWVAGGALSPSHGGRVAHADALARFAEDDAAGAIRKGVSPSPMAFANAVRAAAGLSTGRAGGRRFWLDAALAPRREHDAADAA